MSTIPSRPQGRIGQGPTGGEHSAGNSVGKPNNRFFAAKTVYGYRMLIIVGADKYGGKGVPCFIDGYARTQIKVFLHFRPVSSQFKMDHGFIQAATWFSRRNGVL